MEYKEAGMKKAWLAVVIGGLVHATLPLAAEEPVFVTPAIREACCSSDTGCCSGYRFWAGAEYLLWCIECQAVPVPLVTTGPNSVLGPSGRPGSLGDAGTAIVMGSRHEYLPAMPGGRFLAGVWFGDDQAFG